MAPVVATDRRVRLRRYRKAATAALEGFGVEATRVKFIAHSENVTYRVESGGGRFLLRLHDPHHPSVICDGAQTTAAIEAELQWLAALKRDTPVTVPEPVADGSGEFVCLLPVGAEGQSVPATLLRWVEGRFPPALTLEHCRRVGAMTAQLHEHSRSRHWEKPGTRPTWDHSSFVKALHDLESLLERNPPGLSLTRAQVDIFHACEKRVLATTERGEAERREWGLIHADLHPGNLLFHRGEPRPIDFSRCGSDTLRTTSPSAAVTSAPPSVVRLQRGTNR